METLQITSSVREEIIDITAYVKSAARRKGLESGAILLFCQHTTCGLTINEGADPDVRSDLTHFFSQLAPRSHGWLHHEGNTDAHIKASLLGPSLLIPFQNGELVLGTWQAIYLYEGDGPRTRSILIQYLPAI